jgi:hypothetical protein
MPGLPPDLHTQCRDTLVRCHEFENDRSLRALFSIEPLQPFRVGLPETSSLTERVDSCLDYVLEKRLDDGHLVLFVLLEALRDRYQPGDALRNDLRELAETVQSTLVSSNLPTTPKGPSHSRVKQRVCTQLQWTDTRTSRRLIPPYLTDGDDDIWQFVNKIARCIMEANPTNSGPLVAAHLWFGQRQKALETSWNAIAQLQGNLDVLANGDFETIMEISAAFNQLSTETRSMLRLLETAGENLLTDNPRLYLQNDLRRIDELSSATVGQLESIADQASWGLSPERSVTQIEHNLFPLKELVGDTLKWLSRMVRWFHGKHGASTQSRLVH